MTLKQCADLIRAVSANRLFAHVDELLAQARADGMEAAKSAVGFQARYRDSSRSEWSSWGHVIAPNGVEMQLRTVPPGTQMLSVAALDVLAERQRQIDAEGWTPEHDDEHSDGQMAMAAAAYARHAVNGQDPFFGQWPWDRSYWKPGTSRRDLVKAGALILAELERLDRAAIRAQTQKGGGNG